MPVFSVSDPKIILLVGLLAITTAYVLFWAILVTRRKQWARASPDAKGLGVGFVTNFFDTLGIGSYAPTTTLFRMFRLVPDQHIPGTLNVGHTIPTVVQALIYIKTVDVEFKTLALLILAATAGSWIGAGIVADLPKRLIQRGMGIALLVAATLITLQVLNRLPGGGTALALAGGALVLGCAINFFLGALMTLGIGLYAPSMIMVSLFGMNPGTAFPIMMGSCAFLMPTCGAQFIRREKYDLKAAFGLAIGGIPAVLIAAFIIKSLPLTAMRWLVVVVATYTALTLLRASTQKVAASTRDV